MRAPAISAESCAAASRIRSRSGTKSTESVPARILDEEVDEADDRRDRRAEFLPQKGGDWRVSSAPAAHDRPPVRARSASIFCNSRGNSTGLVS